MVWGSTLVFDVDAYAACKQVGPAVAKTALGLTIAFWAVYGLFFVLLMFACVVGCMGCFIPGMPRIAMGVTGMPTVVMNAARQNAQQHNFDV